MNEYRTATSTPRGRDELQGRQGGDYNADDNRPGERRKYSNNQDRPPKTFCGCRSLRIGDHRVGMFFRHRPTIALIFAAAPFRFGEELDTICTPTIFVIA